MGTHTWRMTVTKEKQETHAVSKQEKDVVKTSEGQEVKLQSPAVGKGEEPEQTEEQRDKHRPLSDEELEGLMGELEPGEEGWIPLSPEGEPTGPAQKGMAPPDQLAHKVVAPVLPPRPSITTPSGAPITNQMNPDPQATEKPKRDYNEIAEQEAERRAERKSRNRD